MRNFCFSLFGKAALLLFQLQHPQCIAERVKLLHRREIKNGKAYRLSVDHHLTTPSSQPIPCIVLYVPTFFYNHHKQRRKLCTLHNFRSCIMLFACASQFSNPEGQRFESSRSHQEQYLMGCCSFCFARMLWGSKKGGDSNSPCPALCVPRGRNAPVGRFQGAAWRIPSGAPKSALQCTFAMRFFSDFRIILVAYHLPHWCTVLLTAVHFSVDLQWYA